MTVCNYKPLRWHEDAPLQSGQFEGTTSLTVPKLNGAVEISWHYVHNLRHLNFQLHQNMCTYLIQKPNTIKTQNIIATMG